MEEQSTKIILHPNNPAYCKECIYYKQGSCTNKKYSENSYMVNCMWKYCKYKKIREKEVR